MTAQDDLVLEVVRVAPSLESELEEHIADYGEILAHVFFGDVARFVVKNVSSSKIEDQAEAEAAIRVIEEAYARGEESQQNVIEASFIENLPVVGSIAETVRSRLLGSLLSLFDSEAARWGGRQTGP
jgi:hypothetical protein